MNKPYAIITARGGSKRIPKKNIRDFCGKPIIVYSIEAALESNLFDEVMVSTDSEEIASLCKQHGANIPFMRSEKTSNDYADTLDVLKEVIDMYKKSGIEFQEFCCIYPTAPFITADKLRESYRLLQDSKTYNVVSMTTFSFPPQRGLRLTKEDYVVPIDLDHIETRSQDLSPIYHDCGQFYWIKTEKFLNDPNILYHRTKPYLLPETEVQDIDNETDWQLAELKYKFMRGYL